MSDFWALSREDKAIIVAVYETEAMMAAVESAQPQKDAGRAQVNMGQVEPG